MAQHYSNPKRESDPYSLPNVETWLADIYEIECPRCGTSDVPSYAGCAPEEPFCPSCERSEGVTLSETDRAGWYWWTCLPGCLPDGEPSGPFDTEAEALDGARKGVEDFDDDPDDEEPEPDEEDYYLSDDERSIYYLGKRIVGPTSEAHCRECSQPESAHLDIDGEYDSDHEYRPFDCTRDATMRALREYVRDDGYFPNVWEISDHGNATLISVLECGCYFTEHGGDAGKCERTKGEGNGTV